MCLPSSGMAGQRLGEICCSAEALGFLLGEEMLCDNYNKVTFGSGTRLSILPSESAACLSSSKFLSCNGNAFIFLLSSHLCTAEMPSLPAQALGLPSECSWRLLCLHRVNPNSMGSGGLLEKCHLCLAGTFLGSPTKGTREHCWDGFCSVISWDQLLPWNRDKARGETLCLLSKLHFSPREQCRNVQGNDVRG